jgi:hypothetical protein
MTNRAKKISELPVLSTPTVDDLLVIVDSPSSNAVTKQVSVGDLFGARIISGTPTSSSMAATAGTIMYDSTYLYIAVTTDVWKRISLSSF